MQKTNYQLMTDKEIERLCAENARPQLLLHCCCAPCSSYVLYYLTKYFNITLFFSNPNITDRDEYEKRLREVYKFCKNAPFCKDVTVVEDKSPDGLFFEYVKGFENQPEGGSRCEKCFKLRLSRTADYARQNGFSLFATTLTVSPHKNADLINKIGFSEAERCGIEYLPSDFKKREGYKQSIVLSKEYNIYRQIFCGCEFSRSNGNA